MQSICACAALDGGDVQELAHNGPFSHGKWKTKVQIDEGFWERALLALTVSTGEVWSWVVSWKWPLRSFMREGNERSTILKGEFFVWISGI